MSEFGKEYRDRLTGFVGKCGARAEYIDGHKEALICPAVGSDGVFRAAQWLPLARLVDTETDRPPVGFTFPDGGRTE